MKRRGLRKNEIRLRPVFPNAGVEAAYRKALRALVDEMAASVRYWVAAAYRANPPEMASDDAPPSIAAQQIPTAAGKLRWVVYVDGQPIVGKKGQTRTFATEGAAVRAAKVELGQYLPAEELQEAMNDLAVRWQSNFDAMAPKLARYFSKKVSERSDGALRAALKKGGISVDFQMTPAMADVLEGTVQQNVALIKSIPQQYLTNVQGAVMRSVQTGGDLKSLTDYLVEQHGVTRRRAATIALDQNSKASSAMQRARQTELGIDEAIWRHSGAGREPRPKHVAANGTRYKVSEGLPIGDKGQYVWPGEEINCRCVGISIVRGF